MVNALVKSLGTALVPYLLLLVVPLMGRMSDPDAAVRQLSTATFAPMVALLPLAQVTHTLVVVESLDYVVAASCRELHLICICHRPMAFGLAGSLLPPFTLSRNMLLH